MFYFFSFLQKNNYVVRNTDRTSNMAQTTLPRLVEAPNISKISPSSFCGPRNMPTLEAAPRKRKYRKRKGFYQQSYQQTQMTLKNTTNPKKPRKSKRESHQADYLQRQRELLQQYEGKNKLNCDEQTERENGNALNTNEIQLEINSCEKSLSSQLSDSEPNLGYQVSSRASNLNAVNPDDSKNSLGDLIEILEEGEVKNCGNISLTDYLPCSPVIEPEKLHKYDESEQPDEVERSLIKMFSDKGINILSIEQLPNIDALEAMSEHETHYDSSLGMSNFISSEAVDKVASVANKSDDGQVECSALELVTKRAEKDQKTGENSSKVFKLCQTPSDNSKSLPENSTLHASGYPKNTALRGLSADTSSTEARIFKRSLSLSRNQAIATESVKKAKLISLYEGNELLSREEAVNPNDKLSQILSSMQEKRVGVSSTVVTPSIMQISRLPTQSEIFLRPTHSCRPWKKHSITKLMPWIDVKMLSSNEPHLKYEVCSAKLMAKDCLVALFKCMDPQCSFATNSSATFYNHLCQHEMDKRLGKIQETFYLQCSYCLFKASHTKILAHHINDVHSFDLYQCGNCFFRSREIETCYQHSLKYHSELSKTIYKCAGRVMDETRLLARLKQKRQRFVVPITCKSKLLQHVLRIKKNYFSVSSFIISKQI